MKIASTLISPTERCICRCVPSPQSNSRRSPPRRTSTAAVLRRAEGTEPPVPRKIDVEIHRRKRMDARRTRARSRGPSVPCAPMKKLARSGSGARAVAALVARRRRPAPALPKPKDTRDRRSRLDRAASTSRRGSSRPTRPGDGAGTATSAGFQSLHLRGQEPAGRKRDDRGRPSRQRQLVRRSTPAATRTASTSSRASCSRFETKEGIGLGDKGTQVAKAYPKAIKTANRTGYIVEGPGQLLHDLPDPRRQADHRDHGRRRQAPGLSAPHYTAPPQAPVAQLDRAPPSGGGGRRFESCRARQFTPRKCSASRPLPSDRWVLLDGNPVGPGASTA